MSAASSAISMISAPSRRVKRKAHADATAFRRAPARELDGRLANILRTSARRNAKAEEV